ncbi:MAG: Si-specific NAD(P)(+) transhydrogenase [Fimbriimonadales bacterium]|nr:Si-specific NAD(P)(+) transhydrogenase [Fimbriimonadales bacterium]
MATHYDLVVLGSGPAGHHAAIQAAKLGKRVAVVERGDFVGGTCFASGTIPSKTLREAVLYLSGFRQRALYGMAYRVKENITIQDLMFRCKRVIEHEVDVYRAHFSRNGVSVYQGHAEFVNANVIRVRREEGDAEVRGSRIIIATGTRPASSAHFPVDGVRVLNPDALMYLPGIPRSMIVVGGGVIGMEYAGIFAALGTQITLVDGRRRLLEFIDGEILEALMYHMRAMGVTFRLGEEVARVEIEPDGGVNAFTQSNKQLHADAVIYAAGRQGNTDQLNLEAAGLSADDRGRLTVDEDFRTEVSHVYAAGDIVGFPSLASTSMEQGRVAACRAFGVSATMVPELFPYGLYTIPEVSFVGPTEEELTQSAVPYEVGIANYREIARGTILGDETGRLKLIFNRENEQLLAVHIIGEGATELVHIGQAVIAHGGSIRYFLDHVFNYPTLAECYKVAALNGLNKIGAYRLAA